MSFWKLEWRAGVLLVGGLLFAYYLPVELFTSLVALPAPVVESLLLVRWYAREHVLLCLVPAFFIAGAIGVFVSQGAVMKYLGPKANKVLAYGVASVSGSILAVCSCTVLPLFAGIYKRGAGLGPASGPIHDFWEKERKPIERELKRLTLRDVAEFEKRRGTRLAARGCETRY